jgi:hypothetical protein
MSRSRRYAAAAALVPLLAAAAAAGGCSDRRRQPQARSATVHLSTENRDANAAVIADLVRRTCLAAIDDPVALATAIGDSGWSAEPVAAGGGDAPAVWRLDQGEIVHSAMAAPGGRFGDCVIALDPEIAPRPDRMRDALAPILAAQPSLRRTDSIGAIIWQWRPGPGEERELTIGARLARRNAAGVQPGLSIHLASAHYDPRRPDEPGPPALLDDLPAPPDAATPAQNNSVDEPGT